MDTHVRISTKGHNFLITNSFCAKEEHSLGTENTYENRVKRINKSMGNAINNALFHKANGRLSGGVKG